MSKSRADDDDELLDPDFPEDDSDAEDDDDDRPAVRSTKKKHVEKSRGTADSDDEDDDTAASETGSESAADTDDESDEDSEADPEEDVDEDAAPSSGKSATQGNARAPAAFKMNRDEDSDSSDDDDDEEDDRYLQKFDESLKHNIITEYHPELQAHNYDEVDVLTRVVRNESGIIVDPMHRTLPFVSKYEKARILGERAKQINSGAKPFIEVDSSTLDGYLIALAEFEQKKIPFIVKRPLPNGGCEYWRLRDLEVI